MIDMRHQLEQLTRTSHGQALKQFLQEEKAKIGDITSCNGETDLEGRKHALNLINKLFAFMEEKEVKNRPKGDYL